MNSSTSYVSYPDFEEILNRFILDIIFEHRILIEQLVGTASRILYLTGIPM
jgi:hypothetical protein